MKVRQNPTAPQSLRLRMQIAACFVGERAPSRDAPEERSGFAPTLERPSGPLSGTTLPDNPCYRIKSGINLPGRLPGRIVDGIRHPESADTRRTDPMGNRVLGVASAGSAASRLPATGIVAPVCHPKRYELYVFPLSPVNSLVGAQGLEPWTR